MKFYLRLFKIDDIISEIDGLNYSGRIYTIIRIKYIWDDTHFDIHKDHYVETKTSYFYFKKIKNIIV